MPTNVTATKALLTKIVDIQIERMKKYLHDRRIDIVLTDSTKEFLADIGYDPVYGARPLKRAIQKEILNLEMDDRKKMELVAECGECEFRISEGSDEYLQLEAFLAKVTLAGSK